MFIIKATCSYLLWENNEKIFHTQSEKKTVFSDWLLSSGGCFPTDLKAKQSKLQGETVKAHLPPAGQDPAKKLNDASCRVITVEFSFRPRFCTNSI